jgi:poly(A) polymerase
VIAAEKESHLVEVARELARTFATAGRQLYLVGGPVRDQLLGRPVHDVDLTTDAPPEEIKRLASRARPYAVYDVGAKFGTIGLIFKAPGEAGDEETSETIEITTFRTEQYVDGTRKPEVTFGTSLEEDLARRDFTMNAIAVDLRTAQRIDPYGGVIDIERRVIRAVGDAGERFREDPLRLLRAVRFAAQLGFRIEEETNRAIAAHANDLERISRERIADELTKILLSPRSSYGMRLATALGLMAPTIPEVLPMRGVSQRPLHHKDVFEHTMGVLDNSPPDKLVRWAALLHDVGKPATKSVHDGEVHFFGHEEVGERMSRRILNRLHFDRVFIERVCKLVKMHLRVNSYDSEWTDSAVRRLIREAGEELEPLVLLSRADVTSYRSEKIRAAARRADEFERRVSDLLAREDVAQLSSPLDGNDLMALFGKGPGPWIKPIKDYLLGLVLDGELSPDDKDRAVELARAFAEQRERLNGARSC